MCSRLSAIFLLLAALSGCGEPVRVSVPTSHPASSEAESAPVPEPSSVLALPAAAPSPRSNDTPTKPDPSTQAQKPAAYECPMHPEVTSDQPGICPKCQMKLKPTVKTGE